MKSKMVDIKIVKGQYLRLETPGGGGYGQPRKREPAAVVEDVRLGYVSAVAAAKDYAVAVDEKGNLDVTTTEILRTRSQT